MEHSNPFLNFQMLLNETQLEIINTKNKEYPLGTEGIKETKGQQMHLTVNNIHD